LRGYFDSNKQLNAGDVIIFMVHALLVEIWPEQYVTIYPLVIPLIQHTFKLSKVFWILVVLLNKKITPQTDFIYLDVSKFLYLWMHIGVLITVSCV
jgi:hypothetical protein